MKLKWHEDLLIFIVAFLFYLILGAYSSLYREYLPFDSLARLVSAWLVLRGTEVKLATIGFVWPPIPTLLILPWALVPPLVHSWLAVVIVSALFMALGCVILGRIARYCGVARGWRLAIVLLFAVNPMIITFGANGMSEAILVAITLAACYWMIRFWRTDRSTALILSAGFFGLLPLIRYEFALIAAWSGWLLAVLSWGKRNQFTPERFRDFLEGRLLAYGSLAIYPIFLWTVASWFVMGNPFYFLANDRTAISLAEFQISAFGLVTNPLFASRVVFGVWTWIFPLGMAATFGAVVHGLRHKEEFLIWFGFMPLLIPIVQLLLLSQGASVPLLRYFIIAIPLGLVVSLALFVKLSPVLKRHRWGIQGFMAGYLAVFILSNIMSGVQLMRYPYQSIERKSWMALTTKEPIENRGFEEAYQIGKILPDIIVEGSRVLIDTTHFGFAIILGAADPGLFMDFTDPDYDAALLNPQGYVDYVIVPSTYQRGAMYSINMAHKNLHEEGASWAMYLDVLPETELEWKLYQVKR